MKTLLLVAAMMAHLGDAVTAFCKGNPSLAALHVQKVVLRLTGGSGQWLEVQLASICSLNLLCDSKHVFVDEAVALEVGAIFFLSRSLLKKCSPSVKWG